MKAAVGLRWSHVGLNCRDQAATEQFYTRWFGFRRARVVDDGNIRVVFLRHGDSYLELFAADPDEAGTGSTADGPHAAGSARHIAFQVDDLDRFLAAADGELSISLGPLTFDEFIADWKTVWLTDPDGMIIEVSQGYADQ